MCACLQTERDGETESKKSPLQGNDHTTLSSPPFSSQDLGHARTRAQLDFQAGGLGLELPSTMWESSNIAITLTAGSLIY